MRKSLAAVMIFGTLTLSACGFEFPDPCADAPVPTQDQVSQAQAGFEIEWGNCELDQNGSWTYDS